MILKYINKRFLGIFAYVTGLSALAWFINEKSCIGIDDANIYMVYMKHLAEGQGFVYEIGGEKVEGFTSLLWTLLGALFFKISRYPETLLLIFNLFIVSYTLYKLSVFLDNFAEKVKPFSHATFLFLGLIAVLPGYIDWAVWALMETGLWSSLLILSFLQVAQYDASCSRPKQYLLYSFIIILLLICRPEAILYVPIFIVFCTLKEYLLFQNLYRSLLLTTQLSLVFGLCLTTIILWRISYFHYPLPNTYYAKVSTSKIDNFKNGIWYLIAYFQAYPFMFVSLSSSTIYGIIQIIYAKKTLLLRLKEYFSFIYLVAILLYSFCIPLYTGGDHFGYFRFIQPFVPLLLLIPFISGLFNRLSFNRKGLIGLIILVLGTSLYSFRSFYFLHKTPISHEWLIAKTGRENGEKLTLFFADLPSLPSQGVYLAGGTAFSYKGKTIDLLGLNQTKMAHADKIKDRNLLKNHASFNISVFHELSPDLFWLSGGFVENQKIPTPLIAEFGARVFKNIHLTARFKREYTFCLISKVNSPVSILVFANKNFLANLPQTVYHIKEVAY